MALGRLDRHSTLLRKRYTREKRTQLASLADGYPTVPEAAARLGLTPRPPATGGKEAKAAEAKCCAASARTQKFIDAHAELCSGLDDCRPSGRRRD
jgi:hypothetical protein